MKIGTLTDLIVIGHELTHGVTQYEANLIYSGESGGLNEHMSDAFAIMCDQWVNKQTADDSHWLIGKDMMVKGKALRSMEKPGTAHPSDRQISSYRDYTEGMGPHTSSGIANKAFCLACKKVGGYAWEKLGIVWYVTLKDKLRDASTFQEAANFTFRVAGDLFGDGSKEQEAVIDGWSQVAIEAKNPNVTDLLVDRGTLLKRIDARL
jgi:Zn-dependent metalloprotease